ncbi:MAG: acyltransferase [Lachnospiraceae bacterium]|nr:acyltransferase [Lachnospiraceae bacterium]
MMERNYNEKNYNSLDLWKFIMSLAVVAIHTQPLINVTNTYAQTLCTIFVSMAVPFFFLASGYLLAKKMDWNYDTNDFIRIKLLCIKFVKLYFVWTIIYSPLAIYHYYKEATPPLRAVLVYIRGLFFVGEHYNSWPLWYLLSAIYTLLVILLFMKLCKRPLGLIVLSLVASILCFGITAYVNYNGTYDTPPELIRKLFVYSIGSGRIFTGLIYIPLGMLLSRKEIPTILNWSLLLLSSLPRFFFGSDFLAGYLTILSAVGLFGIINNFSLKDNGLYRNLRTYSTTIYFIHMYVWSIYYMLIYGKKTYGPDSFFVTALLSITLAILYAHHVKKKKHHSIQATTTNELLN